MLLIAVAEKAVGLWVLFIPQFGTHLLPCHHMV